MAERKFGNAFIAEGGFISLSDVLRDHTLKERITAVSGIVLDNDPTPQILADVSKAAFRVEIDPNKVPVLSTNISERDHYFADYFGYKILSIYHARLLEKELEAWIGPAFVPKDHPLSRVDENKDALVIDLAEKPIPQKPTGKVGVKSYQDGIWPYYAKFEVVDEPGVLGNIAGVFGKAKINILMMNQPEIKEPEEGEDPVPQKPEMVFTFYPVKTENLQKALDKVAKLEGCVSVDSYLRILEHKTTL